MASRSSCGERRQQQSGSWTGRNLCRLIVLAVVPVFGVAAGLVPVAASAAGRTATTTARVVIADAPASPLSPAAPARPSANFWTYETIHRESTISQDDDYDFSAQMTHEMEKVTRKALAKNVTKISTWLSLLANAINAFVHNHPHAAAIVGFIAAVIAVVNVKKVAALWKWLRGIIYHGRHRRTSVSRNGFWAKIFTAETSPPRSYQGWKARTCSTDAISCGSPGDHHKEFWPKATATA
jgi:hypothetical protein